MTLHINLPADIEHAVRERALASGLDLDAYATHVFREEVAVNQNVRSLVSPRSSTYADRLQAWIALHPVLDHPIDDSRESIYAGRGE